MSKKKDIDENTPASAMLGGNDVVVTHSMNSDGKTGIVRVELAAGTVLNRFDDVHRFRDTHREIYHSGPIPENFHGLIPIMRHYYENDGLFGTVIDVLVQLSIDNAIHNVTDDIEVKEFFDAIVETSNIKRAVKCAFLEYYILNNVWPYRTNLGTKKRARSGKEVPLYEWTILNPENIEVYGNMMFGEPKIRITPNRLFDIHEWDLRGLSSEQQRALRRLRDGDSVELDPARVYHIARNKQPFQRYAPVSFKRLIRPLRIKEKYMQMDLSTADGIINQVVLFKLGNDEYPATPELLEKFAKLIQTPTKAYQLVWNHAVDFDVIRAQPEALDPKKYEPVNQELMYGFAVPEVLVGGKAGAYGKDWIAVKSLVERLKWGRDDIVSWIEREFQIIAEENKLNTWPVVKLNNINFEEERTFKNVLMSLYQHGIMSGQTVLENVGFDFLTEVEQLKIEKELRDKHGILVPNSPFQQTKKGTPGRPDDTPEIDPRDRRDPQPAPSGSGSRIYFNATSALEEQREAIYNQRLDVAYQNLKNKVVDIYYSNVEEDERYELILLALIAFRDSMNEIGIDEMSEAYNHSFYKYSDRSEHDEYNAWLGRVLRWNELYVDKLYNDLKTYIEKIFAGEITIPIEEIFDKEHYRLAHFAREGVRRASFVGSVAAHITLGHEQGQWNCTFNNSCEVCIDRHNRMFSIGELMLIFPAHNRCRCYITF